MSNDGLEREIEFLRQENARLSSTLEEIRSKLTEPAEVIRAIRQGEIDALIVQEEGQEELYSLQRFDSVYRTVVEECFPFGVWLAKPDGTLIYVTPSFLELLHTSLREMQQQGQFHFLPPRSREAVEQEWAKSRENGGPLSAEYTVRVGDGTERTIWTQGLLARTHDGLEHWVGVNIDVTEQRAIREEIHRQTEALRLSEERFRLMADAMPQIVWVTRPDGYHEYYNQRWYDYIGCTPEECIGHGWNVPLHPDDRQRAIDDWNRALSTGEPYEVEYRFRGRDGDYRWFLARALPVRDEAGHIVRWFGTCTDIEDIKKAARALEEADRRKDQFLATLAHELRNPLAPIRTGLEVLKLAGDDRESIDEARVTMEQQLKQMVRLVDDLLEVSRITQGKLRLRTSSLELSSAIQKAVETVRPLLEESDHKLTLSLPPEPIYVEADPARLAQVFSNLLGNAAKYTDRGGHILLSAERQEGEVVVSVRDTGIGIPSEHLAKLFEMFSQVDSVLERSKGGLGIGLALVRGLVEMHGGTVAAFSDGPGKGSQFVVRLPTSAATEQQPHGPEHNGGAPESWQKCRILVVDDNKEAARMLAKVLKIGGNEVITAHDGLEAVQMAATFLPRLVLLDIGMPKMNGYDAARWIREQPWGQDMILVAVTGWGQEEDKARALEAGFDRHLTKPVGVSAIQTLLAGDDAP